MWRTIVKVDVEEKDDDDGGEGRSCKVDDGGTNERCVRRFDVKRKLHWIYTMISLLHLYHYSIRVRYLFAFIVQRAT